jgi:hypothetical protein
MIAYVVASCRLFWVARGYGLSRHCRLRTYLNKSTAQHNDAVVAERSRTCPHQACAVEGSLQRSSSSALQLDRSVDDALVDRRLEPRRQERRLKKKPRPDAPFLAAAYLLTPRTWTVAAMADHRLGVNQPHHYGYATSWDPFLHEVHHRHQARARGGGPRHFSHSCFVFHYFQLRAIRNSQPPVIRISKRNEPCSSLVPVP